jgi:probable HAF family extracellular repeat protein
LGTLGGSTSSAHAINDDGQVVGQSTTAKNGPTHAFSWTQAGGMVELDPLPGDSSSYAEAVNDSGQVVGWSVDAGGHSHAVLWQLPAMRISALRLTPANFRAKRHGSSIYLKVTKSAKVTFRLSVPTLVTFTLQRVLSGRLRGKDCMRDSRLFSGLPRCTRQVLRGSFRQVGHTGVNAFPLSAARLNAARLGPGDYLLSATAPASNGALSGPIHFRFTVKPPRLG